MDIDTGDQAAERAKFNVGAEPPRVDAEDFPWGYGENRITAIVRDPDSLYLYWEITDEGIADARSRLGNGGPYAWCSLRIYETPGRYFDGINAVSYFDITVDRAMREYFLELRKPSSCWHAEIGMKSHEGYFQPIARTGPVEFMRKGPSPNMTVEWMTVWGDHEVPASRAYTSRYPGPEPDIWRKEAPPPSPAWYSAPAWTERWTDRSETHVRVIEEQATFHMRYELPSEHWFTEWRDYRFVKWTSGVFGSEWVSPIESWSWEAGPFPIDVLQHDFVHFRLLGGTAHFEGPEGRLSVYGPWQVTIKGAPTKGERRVLGTWFVRWIRTSPTFVQRWGRTLERRVLHTFDRTEWQKGGSAELTIRERGASELWLLGASERAWLGASEWLKMGGSEVVALGASAWMMLGASETRWLGASEVRWAGASEVVSRGASEWLWLGASERALLGASEWMLGGASEMFGASERLGGSEGLLELSGGSEALFGLAPGDAWPLESIGPEGN